MSATAERVAVRVMVTTAWDTLDLSLDPATTVAEMKRAALRQAVGETAEVDDYVVKYRGARVLDEAVTLAGLAVPSQAPFVVLPGRRQPVR